MARNRGEFKMFGLPTGGTKHGNTFRKQTLELNKQLRNLDSPLGHMPWGSTMLQIPELDYYVLIKRFPDLNSPDGEIRTKAWDKFQRSSLSAPYRVRTTDKPGVLQ